MKKAIVVLCTVFTLGLFAAGAAPSQASAHPIHPPLSTLSSHPIHPPL
ncbi:hypothetical protein BN1002_03280 [Bacillus sp. B-jedd]|nr:hypothetical protein BN1002_03280 [Bacillus sp. B-jedd]